MKTTALLVSLSILFLVAMCAATSHAAPPADSSWNLFEPRVATADKPVDFQLFASAPVPSANKAVATVPASPIRQSPRMQLVQVCYGRGNCRWEWQYVQ